MSQSYNIIMPVAITTTKEKTPSLALSPKLGLPDQSNQKRSRKPEDHSNTFLIWDCLYFNGAKFFESLGPMSYHLQKEKSDPSTVS